MSEILFHLESGAPQPPRIHAFREERRSCYDREFAAAGADDFGPFYRVDAATNHFSLAVQDGESAMVYRYYPALGGEVWARSGGSDLYHVRPAVATRSANDYWREIEGLVPAATYLPDTDVQSGGGRYPLGAIPLLDGTVSFGLFHPRAARVYLIGDFNDWQCPAHRDPAPDRYLPLELYRSYGEQPNLWLLRHGPLDLGRRQEYNFFVQGGVALDSDLRPERIQVDPYARAFGRDFARNNALIVDPAPFSWHDRDWRPPGMEHLILYEMSVYGLTQGAPGVPREEQGTFAGVIRQIERGYFRDLGVNTLALMPTAEAPTLQGPRSLGYDPCGFMAIERDFGTPDDFRRLVDTAHRHGLAVLVDAVFNHTANSFNPLWGAIADGSPGGLYFGGNTPWGNRIATERPPVQNMLIDACKLLLKEYHVDGFRFDATHSSWMDHTFLRRLAGAVKDSGFRPDCILVAENLPNEGDLNFQGYNGFAQWCDPFHDKIKALLREGVYQDWVTDDPAHLGQVFYFCRDFYAAHTNNVVNYCESHDENSIPFEVATNPEAARSPYDKSRKARLGLFATLTALGQPMLYMGQEFGVDRPRNLVIFDWPGNPDEDPFFAWARKLINLRGRHPALRLRGYNPLADGVFAWSAGPWLAPERGGGKKAIAWRARAGEPREHLAVAINFANEPVTLDLEVGGDGAWRQVADLDRVEEEGEAGPALEARDGLLRGFTLPAMDGAILIEQ